MPLYQFKNTATGEPFEVFLTFAERETFLAENPHVIQPPCAPGFADPVRLGITKTSDSFNDLIKHVGKGHLGSTVNSR